MPPTDARTGARVVTQLKFTVVWIHRAWRSEQFAEFADLVKARRHVAVLKAAGMEDIRLYRETVIRKQLTI